MAMILLIAVWLVGVVGWAFAAAPLGWLRGLLAAISICVASGAVTLLCQQIWG